MIGVSAVPYEYVPFVWEKIKHYFEPACAIHSFYDVSDVRAAIDRKELALWVMFDEKDPQPMAAATTRIIEYPSRLGLCVDWLGGTRMGEWLPQFCQLLDEYAKDHGCSHVECGGRKGWTRALKPHGYKPWHPTFRKELV